MTNPDQKSVSAILLEREAIGLQVPTWARIGLASLSSALLVLVIQQGQVNVAEAIPIFLGLFFIATVNLYLLVLLRRRERIEWAGLIGVATDILFIVGGFFATTQIIHQADRTRGFVFITEFPYWVALLIIVNALTLRPRYPLIVASGAAVTFCIAIIVALADPLTKWGTSLTEIFPPSAKLDLVLVPTVTMLIMLMGLASIFVASMARRTIREAVESEVARQRLEQEQLTIVMREKTLALGKLVAGISHEINNPLGAVQASIDTQSRALEMIANQMAELDEFPGVKRALGIAEQTMATVDGGLARIADTVESLRAFSHLDEADFQSTDPNQEIRNVIEILPPELKDKGTIELRTSELPEIDVRPREINHIFLTILTNALEAIASEGKVIIETKMVDGEVEVAIKDNGRGIPREQLDGLFDVSLRGKEKRVAAGFGLAIAQSIAHRHDGKLSVNSSVGQGTTFVLRLPNRKKSED